MMPKELLLLSGFLDFKKPRRGSVTLQKLEIAAAATALCHGLDAPLSSRKTRIGCALRVVA